MPKTPKYKSWYLERVHINPNWYSTIVKVRVDTPKYRMCDPKRCTERNKGIPCGFAHSKDELYNLCPRGQHCEKKDKGCTYNHASLK